MTLILTDIWTENLRDISEDDAKAEGVEPVGFECPRPYALAYRDWWDQLHPNQDWTSFPEVVALKFQLIKQNIDRLGEL